MSDGLMHDVDFSDVERLLAGMERTPQIVNEELYLAMRQGVAIAEQQVVGRMGTGPNHTGVNTGRLRSSIHNMVIRRGNSITGKVGTSMAYGWPVERGRAAGKWPPRDNIRMWVVRKMGLTGKEADSVAFLVQRAIGTGTTKGIMKPGGGLHMFEEGFDAALDPVKKLFSAVPGKVIRRIRNS